LRDNVEYSPTIAHGMGFEDVVAIQKPVAGCTAVRKPLWHGRGGVF